MPSMAQRDRLPERVLGILLSCLILTQVFIFFWARPARALPGPDSSLTIHLEDCEASRPGRVKPDVLKDLKPEDLKNDPEGARRLIEDAFKPEKLVKRGRIQVKEGSFDIYLPESEEPYTIVNKGASEADHENLSTLISIDANGDGKLTEEEGWFASQPIRIADRMWEVASIAPDGSRIEIRPSAKRLQGLVLGRKCPPFSYQTEEGKRITQ